MGSGKDYASRFATDLFVIENFGSNGTIIAIGNAWRLLVCIIWGNITLDGFLIQDVA